MLELIESIEESRLGTLEGYGWLKKAKTFGKLKTAIRNFNKSVHAISKESHKKLGGSFPSGDYEDLYDLVARDVIDEFSDMGFDG